MQPGEGGNGAARRPYEVVPGDSGVLVEARSNVGPITFATSTITGHVEVGLRGEEIDLSQPPSALLELPVDTLVSGNTLYDAELRQRLAAQRFPTIRAELLNARELGGDRYSVDGDLTIHGTTRRLDGTVEVLLPDDATIVLLGSQQIDIRDFDIGLPTMLMLKIYPDVLVRYRLEVRHK